MTEEQVKSGLTRIRSTGILVTVLFFVAAIVLATIINIECCTNISPNSGLLPWIIGLTVGIAALFIVIYFIYRALQRRRVKK